MPLNMICCVTRHKDKLAIGSKGQLLFSLKDDMTFFRNITSKDNKNIVLCDEIKVWHALVRADIRRE